MTGLCINVREKKALHNVRPSGLVEDMCAHMVGHPCKEFLSKFPVYREYSVHGCEWLL